MLYLISIKQ